MNKRFCFTIDDNIRFLDELDARQEKDIFAHPYLAGLKRLHEQYGLKVQLNMFYSYAPDTRSLSDISDRYKAQFEENADWLKFSFHARHNDPQFPYPDKGADFEKDFDDVMRELQRVVGEKAIGKTTTVHYTVCSLEECRHMRKNGVYALIALYDPERERKVYYHTCGDAKIMSERSFYYDEAEDIVFVRNDTVINNVSDGEIESMLRGIMNKDNPDGLIQVLLHEQYFYPEFRKYQPNFFERLDTAFSLLRANGYESCLLEECLSDIEEKKSV